MAARRRKARQKAGRIRQIVPLVAVVLCLGMGAGVCMRSCRPPQEEAAELQLSPGPVEEDSLRQEVEARRLAAEERARRQAEEARREPEPVAEPETGALPEEPSTEPEPPSPVIQPMPEQPQEEPAPKEDAGDEDAEPTLPDKPEPPAPATPEEPSEAPSSSEEVPPPVQPQEPAPAPYTGNYNLVGSVSPAMQKQWNEMVERMISRGEIGLFAAGLEQKILEALSELFSGDRFKSSQYRGSPLLVNAVEFCFVAKAAGVQTLSELLRQKDGGAFLTWALTDKSRPLHRLLQAYKLNSGAEESLPYALHTFYKIWRQAPNDRERVRYMNLAIACALVHPDIAKSRGCILDQKEVLMGMEDVFEFYRKGDSGRTLRGGLDLKKMSVSALLHVVDARLPLSEYEWTQKNILLTRDKWKQLYDSIEYRMNHAIYNNSNPYAPYTSYTFAEIKKVGGVCREQAYYTATTAKSAGIPAVIITGDGSRAGHAWVGLMTSDRGGWIQVGSYGYNTGYFTNPCSNKRLHESTLFNQDKNLTDDRLEPAADAMLFSELMMLCAKPEEAVNASRYVCSTFPRYATGWHNRIDLMEAMHKRQPLEESVWKQLRLELERNLGKNSELVDMAQEVDVRHLMGNMRDAAKMTALKRGYKRLTSPMTGRIDLLMDCVRRQADIYVASGNKRDMASFYRQMFKEHKGRGDIYALLVKQCTTLLDKEDKDIFKMLARDAEVNYARQAFNDDDFFKARKDAEVMRAIVKLYRLAGDDARAIRLEKDAEDKLADAAKKTEKAQKNNK